MACETCKEISDPRLSADTDQELVGYHRSVEWSDFNESVLDPGAYDWNRSYIYPVISENRILQMRHPFYVDSERLFWSLYKPTNRGENYWLNNPFEREPESVESAAFVKTRLVAVIAPNPYAAWIEIEIEDMISLTEAADRLTPT